MNKKEIKEMNKEIEKLRKIGEQKNKPGWTNVCDVEFYKYNKYIHDYEAISSIDEDYYIENASTYSVSLDYEEPNEEFEHKFYFVKVELD